MESLIIVLIIFGFMLFLNFLKFLFKNPKTHGLQQLKKHSNFNIVVDQNFIHDYNKLFSDFQKQISDTQSVASHKTSFGISKNLEAESLKKLESKKKALLNKKVKNLEAEGLEKWKKSKEKLLSKTNPNFEKQAVQNSSINHAVKSAQIKSTLKPEINSVNKISEKSLVKTFLKSRSDLKKAFILQEILKQPNF